MMELISPIFIITVTSWRDNTGHEHTVVTQNWLGEAGKCSLSIKNTRDSV